MTASRGRVAHVVRSDAFAGVERYICGTATELSARGWIVTVIGGDPAQMRAELPEQVVHRPAATTLGVNRALAQSGSQDVVHTHMTAAEIAVLPLKGRRYRRLVTTRHFAGTRGQSLGGRLARPFVERRVDTQIAVSSYVAGHIDGDCVVVHSGVPVSVISAPERSRTVAIMQRLEPEKDTATGLRAWALSELHQDGWRLAVYGVGSQQDELQRLANDLGVASSVTFEGFTSAARAALARASIVLAPTPVEGFGFVVLEAMAEGVPVVAADAGAHPETLGADGLFFPAHDPLAAAKALRTLADSSTTRALIGDRLRARHARSFTVGHHVDALERVYLGQLPEGRVAS